MSKSISNFLPMPIRGLQTASVVCICGLGVTQAIAVPDSESENTVLIDRIEALEKMLVRQSESLEAATKTATQVRREKKQLLMDDARKRTHLRASDARLLAGHDGESFYLSSGDSDFKMNIGGLMQYRYIGNFRGDESGRPSGSSPDDNGEGGFEFRRIELAISGETADSKIQYLFVIATEDGAAGVEQIIAQDVKVSYALNENWTIATGRYFAPLLREELIGGGGSLAVALSYMNNELSIGRGEGVSLLYSGKNIRTHLYFSDGAGSGGGGGVNNTFSDASDFAVTGRVDFRLAGEWDQWGDLSAEGDRGAFIGVAAHYEHGESGDSMTSNDFKLFAWTVDASYEANGLHIYGAVAGKHFNNTSTADTDNIGAILQAGYRIPDTRYEPFARGEVLFFDDNLGYVEDTVKLLTLGTNYHYNSRVKFAGDLVWAMDPIPTDSLNAGLLADGVKDNQVSLRLQAQIKF